MSDASAGALHRNRALTDCLAGLALGSRQVRFFDCQNPDSCDGENKKKCPIESSENCLNSAPNPVVGSESHSAAQLSGHWRAGFALLPCC